MTWPFPRVQHFCNWHLCIFSECAKQNKTKNNWVTLGTAWLRTLCSLLKQGTQSCLTLGDPMDCSLPGSSVHGIFQTRILEWFAIFLLLEIFSTQGSNPCLLSWQVDSLSLSHPGSPCNTIPQFPEFILTLIPGHHLHCWPIYFPINKHNSVS